MSKVTEKVKKKKKSIIETTSNLIRTTNFENLTVQQICAKSNISIGTFYHYFTGKDDLIAAVAELFDDYIRETVQKSLISEDEAVNAVCLCGEYAKYMSECGVRYSRLLYSVFPCHGENGETRALYCELKKVFIRGMERGQFRSHFSPDILAEMMVDMLRGTCTGWAVQGGGYDLVTKTVCFAKIFVQILSSREAVGKAAVGE